MERKMFVNSLKFLSLVLILGLCSSTPTHSLSSDGRHRYPLESLESLESLQLTHAQVKSLCGAVSDSRIDNDQLYQWIKIQKEEQQKTKNACYKIGYSPCVGETRYPLTKDCGFFNMVPANEDECSKSGSSRSKRSVSLSHGEAKHLCHAFDVKTSPSDLPSSPDQINYVAVKIDVMNPEDEKVQLPHPAEACVAWAYKPCMSDNKVGCDEWDKIVKPTENCANFHSQDPAVHPQHPHRPKMDQRISNTSLSGMEQFISCKSTKKENGSGIQCEISPVGSEFSTSSKSRHSRHSRQKRQNLGFDESIYPDNTCVTPQCCCGYIDCSCCCKQDAGVDADLAALARAYCPTCCTPYWC